MYDPRLLKPDALRLIALLSAVRDKTPCPALPPPGATVTKLAGPIPGYRRFGGTQVRIDLVERLARAVHDKRQSKAGFAPDPALATSFGIDTETFAAVLRACGFRSDGTGHWHWRSRPRAAPTPAKPRNPAFAALESWGG